MVTEILMPALSPTMEEGTLAKWLVKEGDRVTSGQVIAEIETDKATMEFEAVDEGVIEKILVPEGATGVKVNTPIALLRGEGASVAAQQAASSAGTHAVAASQPPLASAAFALTAVSADARPHATAALADSAARAQRAIHSREWPEGTPSKTMTVREALREALAEEMRRDPTVFLMGEEVGDYGGAYKVSQGLIDEFGPRRVVDTPISEMGFAGIGVGASWGGLRPVVEFMTFNFAMQAIDQIVNSAAKTLYMSGGQINTPIVFRGPNGAAARVAAQHSQCFAAWYSHVPGLKVIMPYTAADAKGLLKAAIRDPNPVVFLENEILYGRAFEVPLIEDFVLPIGKARLARPGRDLTIVSFGIGMSYALEAAERLAAEGVEAEVIDLRTLRPMDTAAIIESVRRTNRLITVEEGWPQNSVGSHIAAVVQREAFDDLDAPVLNICGKDVPLPYAANLERHALVTVDEVIAAAHAVLYR